MKPALEAQGVEFDERATVTDRVAVSSWLCRQRSAGARNARDANRYARNAERIRAANRARRAWKAAGQ